MKMQKIIRSLGTVSLSYIYASTSFVIYYFSGVYARIEGVK